MPSVLTRHTVYHPRGIGRICPGQEPKPPTPKNTMVKSLKLEVVVVRRTLLLVLALALSAAAALPAAASAQRVAPPPREQWFAANDNSHWGNQSRVRIDAGCLGLPEAEAVACSLEAFKAKPFTVIALVDSGINAYHQDFRAPEFTHHPSTYIEGYPTTAKELPLSFDVADTAGYDAARTADNAALSAVKTGELRWIPGTRIIGGISMAAGGNASGKGEKRILDEDGHGTGTSSVAAGAVYGANPNALIVMIEGLGKESVDWAANQPWIDMVSNSWGPGLPGRVDPLTNVDTWREATRRGQTVLFSAGNGMYNTNSSSVFPAGTDPCNCKIPTHNLTPTSYTSGPSFVMTIGAVSPINGQAHWWHGIPVDAASFGSKWAAADAFKVAATDKRDFGGTSCATPITAGVLSAVIERARVEFGDTTSGQVGGVVAEVASGVTPPSNGPLADGKLTRIEAESLVLNSAQPVPFDAEKFQWDFAVEPTTDAYYVQQGYGVVDRDAKARALAALLGLQPLAPRPEVDQWMDATDAARDAIYGAG
jgi:hypothetical protein